MWVVVDYETLEVFGPYESEEAARSAVGRLSTGPDWRGFAAQITEEPK